jgi:peptidoglycan/xylan/chitin deacetylase (PgdA/CDA1 family)
MFTELIIIAPLCILSYGGFLAWYWSLILINTIYWLPKIIFIQTLNYFYPEIITHNKKTGMKLNKKIALTFDDVPYQGLENLNQIVDLLDQYNMKGTFFVISSYVQDEARKKLVNMVMNGHQLGNHGKRNIMHYLLNDENLNDEIKSCDQLLKDIYRDARVPLPVRMVYRPGCGLFHNRMINMCKFLDYTVMLGSVYPNDPIIQHPVLNYYYLKYHIEENDIVIVHDRAWTPRMLKLLLEYLDKNDYESVSVQDLF